MVSPLHFLSSTIWKCGVISKISASTPKNPFLPSLEPSNLNKPPSFFLTLNRSRLQISSNFEIMTEAGFFDVNRISFLRTVSSNKPDRSKPVEKEIISKAFKLLGLACSCFGSAIGPPFSQASNTPSAASRVASSSFSVAIIVGFCNPFLNQELSIILAIDILVLGFVSSILDNNRRTSGANHLGNLNSPLPIFLYISIRFESWNGR
uniref:Uncharacterized protein n=1 Tax=Cajanus cajan TaxID=3821 RepID=A0A151RJF1_CAJCA|nr:hypothetical protein KK1_035922 [Cajanus cajan]